MRNEGREVFGVVGVVEGRSAQARGVDLLRAVRRPWREDRGERPGVVAVYYAQGGEEELGGFFWGGHGGVEDRNGRAYLKGKGDELAINTFGSKGEYGLAGMVYTKSPAANAL